MSEPSSENERLRRMIEGFAKYVPHNHALGLSVLEASHGRVVLRLPYDEKLVGNPETGVLHGGAITALVDAACGGAVFLSFPTFTPIATLDLRIDYLGPAHPREDVIAEAECHHVTKNVAFVRATARQASGSHPVAAASATFILKGSSPPEARSEPST